MAELDKGLSLAMVIDVSIAIVLLMISIWEIVLSISHEPIRRLANIFLMQAIMASFKLLIIFIGNGAVHSQSQHILTTLDNIRAHSLTDEEYRELVLFKTMSRQDTIGFTVAGLGALNTNTMLSVSCFSVVLSS